MEDIIKLLHEGNYSCVIKKEDEIRTFSNRGVKDLYLLLLNDPEFLKGASVADKVVGKAAASLMIMGGINELYTDLISRPALQILNEHNIKTSSQLEVPVILNRDRSDWCPLELLCFRENSPDKILKIVYDFIGSKSK
jgi:iron complex outermembrane receptor protein